ncbi:5-formyltetrahydrofolate cyclo-ligase [Rubricella aquisinus]|uniref:5-formyltetrahydrofolate cyclo-ligase n=1 Tax=Rubricella aquisinus TaxID=2028108 RepID=A0A840WKX0_9RHOB|nr:5-formyltetrahydrofolate cyclo-ligase [Rubricella aquisinus]MBB5515161.1 5-formyltetrahydrofolate cyclo-ligase [Rubricella aquisinus]
MTDMTDQKAAARKAAFAARKAAHGTVDPAPALALLGAEATGRIVSGYMPIRTELDPRPAMIALHAQGARLCVPVIAGEGQPLLFREWTPDCTMVDGPFGAQVPETGAWFEPDTLIVPLLAFDRAGYRLGYGGGFYDRTLERLRALRPTRAIGLAYGAQEVPRVPTEPTDQPLDAIVTEGGVIRP